jgi:DNA mismatch repair ATPase MutS
LIHEKSIKNTIKLDKNLIITGPNASGKTTTLKTALINVILTQQFGCGYYKSANLNPYQHVHCYLNIPDTSGRDSLFQAEARRCKEIIDIIKENTGERHFCVFDELYSGTNPDEAVMSANAFMEYLVKFKNVNCILTTHFIAVCKKLNKHTQIENYHMETKQSGDTFDYTYLLNKGISEVRGGIKVLHDMQYPKEIIENSKFQEDKNE